MKDGSPSALAIFGAKGWEDVFSGREVLFRDERPFLAMTLLRERKAEITHQPRRKWQLLSSGSLFCHGKLDKKESTFQFSSTIMRKRGSAQLIR